jgi:hypothetical protein
VGGSPVGYVTLFCLVVVIERLRDLYNNVYAKYTKKFYTRKRDSYYYYNIDSFYIRTYAKYRTVTRVSLLGADPSANLQARPGLRAEHT